MADGSLVVDSRLRIGLVEDEPEMAMLLSYNLECRGYLVDVMHRGDEAATVLRAQRFDLIILDWMVPGLSGIELLRRLRDTPVTRGTPVIMLTARTTELDIVRALDTGADDFVAKPFSIANLLQRVTVILERSVRSRSVPVICNGGVYLDLASRTVTAGGTAIALSTAESNLLELFLRHPNSKLTRQEIRNALWGAGIDGSERYIDERIKRLTNRIGETGFSFIVEPVDGNAYRYASP